jgi:hypothetical protein
VNLTVPDKKFTPVTVTSQVALPPPKTVRELGLAENPKSVTASVTGILCATVPDDAVMMIGLNVSLGVVLLVITVIIVLAAVLPETVTDGGRKLALAPRGKPATPKEGSKRTVPEKPLSGVIVRL